MKRMIRKRTGDNHAKEKLFLKELKLLQSIHHENIIKFFGAVEKPLSCILEYMEFDFGKDLACEVPIEGMIVHNLDEVLRFLDEYDQFQFYSDRYSLPLKAIADIASGLAYLHGCGVAHRDLKPNNILASNDRGLVFKLTDFGEARSQILMTQTAMLNTIAANDRGTTLFNGPDILLQEVILNHDGIIRHDVWSFGLIIFLLYNADINVPWKHELEGKYYAQHRQIVTQYMRNGLLPRSSLKYRMPKGILSVYKKCCSYQPQERPSMEEVKALTLMHLALKTPTRVEPCSTAQR